MSECTQCRAPIVFARLTTGRYVALDPTPNPTGFYALLDGNRAVLLNSEQRSKATPEVRSRLHRAHNDVCEQLAPIANTVDARRSNRYREQIRATKLERERNR